MVDKAEKCGQYWSGGICELVADPRPVVEHRSGGYISLDQEFLILGNAATIDRQRVVYILCNSGQRQKKFPFFFQTNVFLCIFES